MLRQGATAAGGSLIHNATMCAPIFTLEFEEHPPYPHRDSFLLHAQFNARSRVCAITVNKGSPERCRQHESNMATAQFCPPTTSSTSPHLPTPGRLWPSPTLCHENCQQALPLPPASPSFPELSLGTVGQLVFVLQSMLPF